MKLKQDIIFWIGIFLLSLAIFLILIFAKLYWYNILILLLGIFLLSYLVILRFEKIKGAILKIKWKSATNLTLYIILILGIITLINLISSKRFLRFDLTANKIYTLSEHTLNLLAQLDRKVNIIFFRTPAPMLETVGDILKEYSSASSRIQVDLVDPDSKKALAEKYEIKSIRIPYSDKGLYATIIVESGEKKERFDVVTFNFQNIGGRMQPQLVLKENIERELSSAILNIIQAKKKIYFLSGHQESDLENTEKQGYSEIKNLLDKENYIIDKLFLATYGKIPEDCNVLVIASPKKDLDEREKQILKKYLTDGGKLFILTDPKLGLGLNSILKDWGIEIERNFIIDRGSPYWFQVLIPVVKNYTPHPITEKMKSITFFPEVNSIKKLEPTPSGINVVTLIESSSDSWAETDFNNPNAKFNPGSDIKGPVPILIISEKIITDATNKTMQTRIAVIGDSDFASNQCIDSYGNGDLFVNIINWLAGKEELIGIRSKQPEQRRIELTKEKMNFVFYSSVVLIPLLVLVCGAVVWWKRR